MAALKIQPDPFYPRPGTYPNLTNFEWATFVSALHKIDTKPCPKDFQMAWLEYVHACEQADAKDRHFVFSLLEAGHGDLSGLKPADTLTPWQRVETIALRY